MKIRNVFVSNSSSSSFVLIGKEVTQHTFIQESLAKGKRVFARRIEESGACGEYTFDIKTKEEANLFLTETFNEKDDYKYYVVDELINIDNEDFITIKEDVNLNLYYVVSDYSSVNTLERMKRYFGVKK